MEALLISTGVVALAEMGDKTQLLAFLLAARFKRPWPIVWGILAATILNHAAAAALGVWVSQWLVVDALRWVLGLSFIAMALWILVPDKLDEGTDSLPRYGVFLSTFIAFFLAEMGDKTQIATIGLAAKYAAMEWVVVGTTLGMMLANVPAVFLGQHFAAKIPVRVVHMVAAVIFGLLGLGTLLGFGDLSFGAAKL